jgi:hypothetical protein
MTKNKRTSIQNEHDPGPATPIHPETKPALEKLDFTSHSDMKEPNIEHHVETPTNKRPLSNINVSKSSIDPLKITMIVVFSVIIAFWVLVLILSIQISAGPRQVEKNVTAIFYKPLNISLQRLIDITDTTNPLDINILGYIKIGGPTIYISDDNMNIIPVTIPSEEYSKLSNNSKQLYNISGTYRYSSEKFVFEIRTLAPTKKPLIEQREIRPENVTVGSKAGVKINLADGWIKISEAIM